MKTLGVYIDAYVLLDLSLPMVSLILAIPPQYLVDYLYVAVKRLDDESKINLC